MLPYRKIRLQLALLATLPKGTERRNEQLKVLYKLLLNPNVLFTNQYIENDDFAAKHLNVLLAKSKNDKKYERAIKRLQYVKTV